jgi:hypothetical protein
MGSGKGFLASNDAGERAVEVWKTDPAGAPTHGEGLAGLGYSFDAVLAFFTIDEGRLKVNVAEGADSDGALRLIVELDSRLRRLELQEESW